MAIKPNLKVVFLLLSMIVFVRCGKHESSNFGEIKGKSTLQGDQAGTVEELLLKAISGDDKVEFQKNIELVTDINALTKEGRTYLMQSVMSNKPYFVQELLKKGADPLIADASGKTAMDYAIANNLIRIQLMLDQSKSLTYQADLFANVTTGSTTNVGNLLVAGVNPNVHNENGETPLILAFKTFQAQKKSSLLLTALKIIEWDDPEFSLTATDVNFCNQQGESPLQWVLILEPLVTKNADINNLKKVKAALLAMGGEVQPAENVEGASLEQEMP